MRPGFRVLYAEDNPLDADLTRAHFTRVAPEITLEVVDRAEEFITRARARRHAALLIDRRVRDMDALEVLKLLALESIDTPLVLIGGIGDTEFAAQALRLGADDFVSRRLGYLESLPQRLRDAIERHRLQPALARARSRPRRILLVDDDPAEAEMLVRLLARRAPHLAIKTAANRSSGLEALVTGEEYDLVLGLHRPPANDCFELIKTARDRGFHLPIIVLADSSAEEAVAAAFSHGASDFVVAPRRHAAELALRIDLAIDRHELAVAGLRARTELADRRQLLAALGASDQRLKTALEAGRIGLWSWEVGTGHMEFSARWKAQIGYAENEIGEDAAEWFSRCHPDDLANLHTLTARYLAAPWPDFNVEYRLKHKDGSWRCFLLHAALETDDPGEPRRMVGAQIDVTQLKQQQADIASTSARLQQLSRRLLNVQEMERRSLARELHDEIGQVLTVAKIHLQSTVLLPECGRVAGRLKEPVALLDRLLAQVRSLSLNLRPPLLDDLGLVPALHWLLHQHQSHTGGPRVHLATDPELARFDPTLETACFRIAQEALTNALRHARAQGVHLTLTVQDQKLRLRVQDDGVGFDATSARGRAERGGSLGLLGMHERALLAGGTLTLLSAPGRGTEIEAIFPLSIPPGSRLV
ncbi:hybrid sensor histidine kinase/response regulator [Opitutus terrae]|uniref:Multi-sensor signal transduction histidine kinase n=1 Tax=Opitutus terrae (strain DSM 11246 / JCM 15787 / PB90-1) TaxID=452637 RepID=B1ZVL9_OPITP|nr:response regulator [Opitutus terrae]ACB74116.1 multi-sensor signal transduction histidine kinase [Opitutus terrae PB90-1]